MGKGVDYYSIEEPLSEEERMTRDAVRDWVEAELLPIVAEHPGCARPPPRGAGL